jgi:hypothetical protein
MKIIELVYKLAEARCRKCPAFWSRYDFYGLYDEGCDLHRDVYGFCILALFPRWRVRLKVWKASKRKDRLREGRIRVTGASYNGRALLEDTLIEEFDKRQYKIQTTFGEAMDIRDAFLFTDNIACRFFYKIDEKRKATLDEEGLQNG